MINDDKLKALETGEPLPGSKAAVEKMSHQELLVLKSYIEKRLPAGNLSSLNLEHELVEQYNTVKALQNDVLTDSGIPLNQRSQLAGQVASTLQQLVKMQSEFHTAERFKAVENLMIKYFKKLPKETVEKFLEEYEALSDGV